MLKIVEQTTKKKEFQNNFSDIGIEMNKNCKKDVS